MDEPGTTRPPVRGDLQERAAFVRALVVDENESQRARLRLALESIGIIAVSEAASQLEALVLAASQPIDIIVYPIDVERGDEQSFGDLRELGQSVSVVLNGPLSPAMVESVTPLGRDVAYPLVGASDRPVSGRSLEQMLAEAQAQMAATESFAKTITISRQQVLQALEDQELRLHFQPMVSLTEGRLVSAEALLRWQHPSYGLLHPSVFLDRLEQSDLGERIVLHVFEMALATSRRWIGRGLRLPLYVNLSDLFLGQRGAANQLLGVAGDYPEVDASLIVFNITEKAIAGLSNEGRANLTRLQVKGYRLALDSYAARSDAGQLALTTFSFLKLNPTLLLSSGNQERVGTIVATGLALAHELSLVLVAQGVRTVEDRTQVASIGFQLAEGDLISKALPEDSFFAWAQANAEGTDSAIPPTLVAERKAAARMQSLDIDVGSTLGSYRLEALLGKGGLGKVFLANDTRLLRPVALKICLDKNLSPETVERFVREARALARVQHPGVVTIYDIGLEPWPHIAMEVLAGKDLQKVLQGGPVDPAQACDWTIQMLEALTAVHARGIVHRDLKPSNVMLDADGRIRIMDFGIAKILEDDPQLTATGQYCGTPQYMSPEQIDPSFGTVDERSDLFAIGSILYELLSGRPPVRLSTVSHILSQLLLAVPTPPCEVNPAVPQALSDICMRALEKRREERYSNARAFQLALRGAEIK